MKFTKRTSLAVKWRPKKFSNLVGQSHIIKFLKSSIKYNNLNQSYLFFGPSGVGKTSLARIFIKYLNCLKKKNYKFCNKCINCKLINSNNFSDCLEINGANNRGVDEISNFLSNMIFLPIYGLYKIYIIDEFHMLSNHALSLMLKLLEEPPLHVKFILITTDLDKIPITIISRCICLNFKLINIRKIILFIFKILINEKVFFKKPALILIANSSNGNLRDALSITERAIFYSNKNIKLKFVLKILNTVDENLLIKLIFCIHNSNINYLLKLIKFFKKNNISFINILFNIINIFYELIIIQFSDKLDYNLYKNKKSILYLSKIINPNKIQNYYQILISNIDYLKNFDNHITLFMILLKLISN